MVFDFDLSIKLNKKIHHILLPLIFFLKEAYSQVSFKKQKDFSLFLQKRFERTNGFYFNLVFRFLNYDQFHNLKTPCPCKSGGHRYFANALE